MDNVTLLVNSCDKYSDLWYPFFELLKIHWPNCKYPIVLNTESKTYSHDGLDIRCMQIYKSGENVPWSLRLIETLKRIDTKYILFMLDDFFILSPVNYDKLKQVLRWMNHNPFIGSFTFQSHYVPRPEYKSKIYKGFERIPKNDIFRINCNHGIWRKRYLLKCLEPGESAWDFEVKAGERRLLHFDKYYCRPENEPPIIEAYFRIRFGYGIANGKWLWKNTELFNKHGIKVDFSARGMISEHEVMKKLEEWHTNHDQLEDKRRETPKRQLRIEEAKRYIPVKMRIKLSRIKQALKG